MTRVLPRHVRRTIAVVATLLPTLLLAGCGGSAESTGKGVAVRGEVAAGSPTYLADVCPATMTFLTDWLPTADHGELYQMVGGDVTVDAARKRVTGTFVDAEGRDTGVDIAIQSGGPAIGFSSVTNQLFTDPDIFAGYVATDDAMVAAAQGQPVTAVVGTKETSPMMVMWDPETHPDVGTMADVKAAGIRVHFTEGYAYMDFLLGTGQLSKEQVVGDYDGSPATFVAAGGEDAQQGYATSEPYKYEHQVRGWMKPVDYAVVADSGFDTYVQALSMPTERVESNAPCLEKLVPIVQAAQIAWLDDPEPANDLLVAAVEAYDTGWEYTADNAAYSTQMQRDDDLAIVSNGPDSTLGNFDLARIDDLIDVMRPILADKGVRVPASLTAESIATNRFIDPQIGLPSTPPTDDPAER